LEPWEFERLQVTEFLQLYDGYRWRKEQSENMQAYFTSCAMSVHTKKPVQPKDLLKSIRKSPAKHNKKQDESYLREMFKKALQQEKEQ
jgi:hypothetical protein